MNEAFDPFKKQALSKPETGDLIIVRDPSSGNPIGSVSNKDEEAALLRRYSEEQKAA